MLCLGFEYTVLILFKEDTIEMAERTAQGKRRGVDSLEREAKQTQVFRFGKEMADG